MSTRQVMSFDGKNLLLLESGRGPHFLCCDWDPKNNSVVIVGSFGAAYQFKDGNLSALNVDLETNTVS